MKLLQHLRHVIVAMLLLAGMVVFANRINVTSLTGNVAVQYECALLEDSSASANCDRTVGGLCCPTCPIGLDGEPDCGGGTNNSCSNPNERMVCYQTVDDEGVPGNVCECGTGGSTGGSSTNSSTTTGGCGDGYANDRAIAAQCVTAPGEDAPLGCCCDSPGGCDPNPITECSAGYEIPGNLRASALCQVGLEGLNVGSCCSACPGGNCSTSGDDGGDCSDPSDPSCMQCPTGYKEVVASGNGVVAQQADCAVLLDGGNTIVGDGVCCTACNSPDCSDGGTNAGDTTTTGCNENDFRILSYTSALPNTAYQSADGQNCLPNTCTDPAGCDPCNALGYSSRVTSVFSASLISNSALVPLVTFSDGVNTYECSECEEGDPACEPIVDPCGPNGIMDCPCPVGQTRNPASGSCEPVSLSSSSSFSSSSSVRSSSSSSSEVCTTDSSCDDGNVCTTNRCAGGDCRAYPKANCCIADSDCDENEVCDTDDNTCIEVECTKDSDCDSGEQCNLTTNTCVEPSSSSSSVSTSSSSSSSSSSSFAEQCTNIMPCQGITTNKGWCSYMQEVADQYIPDLYWIYTPPTSEFNQYEGCCDCIGDDSVCPGGGTTGGDTGGGQMAVIFGDKPSTGVVSGLKLSTFVMSLSNDQSQALDFFDSPEFKELSPTDQKDLINAFYDSQNVEELNIFLRSIGLVSNAISSLFSIFN